VVKLTLVLILETSDANANVCGVRIQPVAFEVSFLEARISIDDPVLYVSFANPVEKRPIRLRLEVEMK